LLTNGRERLQRRRPAINLAVHRNCLACLLGCRVPEPNYRRSNWRAKKTIRLGNFCKIFRLNADHSSRRSVALAGWNPCACTQGWNGRQNRELAPNSNLALGMDFRRELAVRLSPGFVRLLPGVVASNRSYLRRAALPCSRPRGLA